VDEPVSHTNDIVQFGETFGQFGIKLSSAVQGFSGDAEEPLDPPRTASFCM
jgi:hypothetical protein